MVIRMFAKMMIYLTIGVVSVNYLIDSHQKIANFFHPTLTATLIASEELDEEGIMQSHHLLE